ncbi:hypothetical protein A3D77_06570 [Candidatus Gottesmanbacteria bacterium RIFCSPHIGHO2_02_FULL_39_11]|uniref:UPF0102 protein A3D77_06570 n=1 Tax=Candidatus Gottesmanbacteria bacterium RIFCSPHIGHO2_02_FULL_39_11 TaxID=1798382 RepID=A0A1F5ZT10_9BACT|nr:MAG: hypothetical protein A3D77_06570 [Candidatus Gottesmanbacteria bacterium RIFCSPHIGHO2_02_FULL_39_11]
MNSPLLPHNLNLGSIGEEIASSYLQKKGFHIIDKNFRIRGGEIDLIGIWGKILIFIEVKTRIGDTFGPPEEAIDKRKLYHVTKSAEYYKLLHPHLPDTMRIDAVCISLKNDLTLEYINHYENVTG